MIKLHNKIKNLSTFKLILVALTLMFIVQILTSPLYHLYPVNNIDPIAQEMFAKPETFSELLADISNLDN